MARGVPISNPPLIDRTLLGVGAPTSPKFNHIEYNPPPSTNALPQETELQANSEPVSAAILNLSVDQINILKSKSEQDNGTTIKFSRFEILAAHIWRCLCKARGLSSDQASKLTFPVDGRSRLNPRLPLGYIGNAIFTGAAIGLSGDIQLESLNLTAKRIHESLMQMDNEYLKSALAYLNQQPDLTILKRGSHAFNRPILNISNLFHMPVYDVNFGWGKPIFFRPITPTDGVAHVLRSPRNDGSSYVVINLKSEQKQHFKELFYEIFSQC